MRSNDKLISLYLELLEHDKRAFDFAETFPVPTWEMVRECAIQSGADMPESTVTAACDFIMVGSDRIQEEIQRLTMDYDTPDKEQGPKLIM